MDRFLIKEDLLGTLTNLCQWDEFEGIYDHSPIYMELAGPSQKPRAPYKFNLTWLQDLDCHKLVTDFWRDHPPAQGRNLVEGFVGILWNLKVSPFNGPKQNNPEMTKLSVIFNTKLLI